MTRTHPLLDCHTNVSRGSAWLDGSLSRTDRWLFATHTFFCRDCKRHMKQLRTTISLVRSTARPNLSPASREALLAALERESRR